MISARFPPYCLKTSPRRRRDAEKDKEGEELESAEMAEIAEKTLFFNSLRLRVSAVIIRSWRNPGGTDMKIAKATGQYEAWLGL